MSDAINVLERMPPAPTPEPCDGLPQRAESMLGYGLLAALDRRLALRRALDELGVSPFTDESVERYKQAVLAEANKGLWKGRWLAYLPGVGALLSLVCFGPALLGWFVSWKVGLAAVIGLIAGLAMCVAVNGTAVKEEAFWRMTPLRDYGSPVPKPVLDLAVQLKKRLPKARFHVHELVQQERVLDPFLAVTYAETTYFIAAWDEPEFDARSL